jgi:transcriptional regulator with XRE-family HTH domain
MPRDLAGTPSFLRLEKMASIRQNVVRHMAAKGENPARSMDISVGDTVRLLRERNGISVRTLAARAGFSPSFISQVENGQASPSINSLQEICSALGVTLGEFFHAFSPKESPVVRASERGQITSGWSKGTIQSLTGTSAPMEAILVTLAPGGASGKHAAPQAQGEFAYLLEGSLTLSLNGQDVELMPGDCVTIRPGSERVLRNLGEGPAQIIIVSGRKTNS